MRCKCDALLTEKDYQIDPTGEYCTTCIKWINQSLNELQEQDRTKKFKDKFNIDKHGDDNNE